MLAEHVPGSRLIVASLALPLPRKLLANGVDDAAKNDSKRFADKNRAMLYTLLNLHMFTELR
jgi:hypothetical protein